ncbi:exodeoxyribonuclease VII small subunit [Xylocopilactobacillus apicola]|uniref:Exodeoxyribonuclease 7 small subunit n=1 Tax=Xylocopilactobacillus apicola TaxID=2932184 RepID=A0AAU9CVX7_9LACO|nr:exodeoxyribonuclease VII small subunit [Xylocopilactobacillus apicola]BDR58147.1 exodeoxyribonuclease 7 small subunit [Xylocopilactobacillus apicola]
MVTKKTAEENLSFEEQMQKLEEIVKQLEAGNLPLQESIDQFKQGVELSKKMEKTLSEAQKSIASIIDEKGELKDFAEQTDDEGVN